ncbi:extracellular solute-binding protein [Actinopolymorpha pittospori]|uniref:Aldouronate transport system substrate-binding protein n=1 Tax=Actinopolymorpha pittospori TaxID=648752 RepID=A0A927MX68_9ACTN|nr:extracellular solute-binding protein [Actinopolymorpha pittospori]MBE1608570.1 putative aldouronate transport system substrate-binding protein [Actinopolymorpha pittospori]
MLIPLNRRVAAAVVAVALTGSLAACGSDADGGDKPTGITMMLPFYQEQPEAADDPRLKKLEEITGTDITVNWVPDASYNDKLNVTLAGDGEDLPEIMVASKTPGFIKSAEAGAFWDLTDKLADYPNLANGNPDVHQMASVNGTLYGIYRYRDPMRVGVIVRKDWLEKVGMEMPKTTGDLYAVAKAFTEQDPDGNGKDDTTGLIIPKWPGSIGTSSPYDVIETWYGAGNGWTERNGQLVPGFTTEEFIEADKFIRKMVSEGLINKDFATLDSATWNEPFYNGKGGIIIDVLDRSQQLYNLWQESDPDNLGDYVEITGQLRGPDGQLYAYPTTGYNGFMAIPRGGNVKTEEDLNRVLTFLDKLNSKEAQIVMNNGIEGTDFTLEGDLAVPKDPAKETSWAQLRCAVDGYTGYAVKLATEAEQATYDKRIGLWKQDLKSAVYNPGAAYVSETYISRGAQLDNMIADARIKFIAGQIDEQGLRDAIQQWRSSGGDDVIKETNDLWKADQ